MSRDDASLATAATNLHTEYDNATTLISETIRDFARAIFRQRNRIEVVIDPEWPHATTVLLHFAPTLFLHGDER